LAGISNKIDKPNIPNKPNHPQLDTYPLLLI
jgi:hypothetical protein